MNEINRISDFPLIRQDRIDWCVAANIEAVLRYFDPNTALSQREIMNRFQNAGGKQPNFRDMVHFVLEQCSGHIYDFDCSDRESYSEYLGLIFSNIYVRKLPIMISYPIRLEGQRRVHIVTVLAYSETMIKIFDPSIPCIENISLKDFESLIENKGRDYFL